MLQQQPSIAIDSVSPEQIQNRRLQSLQRRKGSSKNCFPAVILTHDVLTKLKGKRITTYLLPHEPGLNPGIELVQVEKQEHLFLGRTLIESSPHELEFKLPLLNGEGYRYPTGTSFHLVVETEEADIFCCSEKFKIRTKKDQFEDLSAKEERSRRREPRTSAEQPEEYVRKKLKKVQEAHDSCRNEDVKGALVNSVRELLNHMETQAYFNQDAPP
ncbi:hypothetical protein PROFUN_06283 [Planoprotostelium fungivorum]|uniref:Uncharacterized protein n=1 Tax=Planoprotostelium fungivorum TaxID=1890364 RepID=A0A2P6NEB4_9EUKA|nr:hypothetical protein PROFUN_06283 [Planoprotostelium fungivorum]